MALTAKPAQFLTLGARRWSHGRRGAHRHRAPPGGPGARSIERSARTRAQDPAGFAPIRPTPPSAVGTPAGLDRAARRESDWSSGLPGHPNPATATGHWNPGQLPAVDWVRFTPTSNGSARPDGGDKASRLETLGEARTALTGRRGVAPGLPAGRPGERPADLTECRRSGPPRWPKLRGLMDESEDGVLAYMAFPAALNM